MGRKKEKVKQKESLNASKTGKASSSNLMKKGKKKRISSQMKGEKLKEEIANIDNHFASLQAETVPKESCCTKEEESSKPAYEVKNTISDKDVEDALDQMINL